MNDESQSVSTNEAYLALVQLVIHAESISWNRFYNFLMANSILVLAWATISVSPDSGRPGRKIVLAAICVFGGASGIVWAGLGARGRCFVFDFVKLGQTIESDPSHWPENLGAVKPLSTAAHLRDTGAFRWTGSFYLLAYGSLAFTALYSVMLVVSVGWCMAAAPLAIFGVGILSFVTEPLRICRRQQDGELSSARP
jgi:hypothetical protein